MGEKGSRPGVFSDSELKAEGSKDTLRGLLGSCLARAEILQETVENNIRKVSWGPATDATGAT